MQDDDKLYGLITQAEDIQKHAVTLQRAAQEAVKGLPDGYREAVKGAASEILTEAAQNASTALLGACNEAKASSAALRHTGLFQAVFLLLATLIIAGASFRGFGWLIQDRLNELAAVKIAIQQEQDTLAELQSKTWRLELVEKKGDKYIILPKGVKIGQTGEITDKSGRIGIIIKP